MANITISIKVNDSEAKRSLASLKKEYAELKSMMEAPIILTIKSLGLGDIRNNFKTFKSEVEKPISLYIKTEMPKTSVTRFIDYVENKKLELKVTSESLSRITNVYNKLVDKSVNIDFYSKDLLNIIKHYDKLIDKSVNIDFYSKDLLNIRKHYDKLIDKSVNIDFYSKDLLNIRKHYDKLIDKDIKVSVDSSQLTKATSVISKIDSDIATVRAHINNLHEELNNVVNGEYFANFHIDGLQESRGWILLLKSELTELAVNHRFINIGLTGAKEVYDQIANLSKLIRSFSKGINIDVTIHIDKTVLTTVKSDLKKLSSNEYIIRVSVNQADTIEKITKIRNEILSLKALSPIKIIIDLTSTSVSTDIKKINTLLKTIKSKSFSLTANVQTALSRIQSVIDLVDRLTSRHHVIEIDVSSSSDRIRTLTDQIIELNRHANTANTSISNMRESVIGGASGGRHGGGQGWLRTFGDDIQRIIAVGFGAHLVKEGVKAVNEFISMSNALEAMLGTQENAAKANKYLKQTAQDLGLSYRVLTVEYTKFIASAKAANITSEEFHKTFKAVNVSASVLNFTAEQTHGIFKALGQIMSKGKVQAEELRGQLGEHLYGAFELVAQGMKKTTMELDTMLKRGELTSRDMIIALPKALMEAYGPGLAVAVATGRAELQRFTNDLQMMLDNNKEGIDELIFSIGVSLRKALAAVSQDSSGFETLEATTLTIAGTIEIIANYIGHANAGIRFLAVETVNFIKTLIDELIAFKNLAFGIADFFSHINPTSKLVGSFSKFKEELNGIEKLNSEVTQMNANDLSITVEKIRHSQKLLDFNRQYRADLEAINNLQISENDKIKKRNELVDKFLKAETPELKGIFKSVVNDETKFGPGTEDWNKRMLKAQNIINRITLDTIKLKGQLLSTDGKDEGLSAYLEGIREKFREIGIYGKILNTALAKGAENYRLQQQLENKKNGINDIKIESEYAKKLIDIAKSQTEYQIESIDKVKTAKLDNLAVDKMILDFQESQHRISAFNYYDKEIELINKNKDAKIEALIQQKSLQNQLINLADQEIDKFKIAYAAIRKLESSNGDENQLVNISKKKDGSYNGTALGPGQAMISTLLDPGVKGVSPFQPLADKGIIWIQAFKKDAEEMKNFAIQYKEELDAWSESYFNGLIKRELSKGKSIKDAIIAAVQQYGEHTPEYRNKFLKIYDDLSGQTEKLIKLKLTEKDIDESIRAANNEAEVQKLEATNNLISKNESYIQGLEQERLKLVALTKDAALFADYENKINLKYNSQYKNAVINDNSFKGVPFKRTNDAQVFLDNASISKQDKINKEAKDYESRLIAISKRTKEVGLTSTQAFDLIHQGLGGISNAFDDFVSSVDKLTDALKLNAEERNAADNEYKNRIDALRILKKDDAENSIAYDKAITKAQQEQSQIKTAFDKEEMVLKQKKAGAEIDGMRQIVQATGAMFGENIKARQAFHAVEMTLGAIELAFKIQSEGVEALLKAKSMALSVVNTGVKMAEGAANMFAQSGWGGFAGVAAMVAVMAGLGFAGRIGSHIAKPPKSSPDTGTVLGNSTAQSESINNIGEILKDIHASEFKELRGINIGVSNLKIALANTITTLFQAGGLSNKGFIEESHKGSYGQLLAPFLDLKNLAMTIAIPVLGGLDLLNSVFSGGYKHLEQQGIATKPQTIGNFAEGKNIPAWQYNVIKTREWDLFGDSTRFDTITNLLDQNVVKAISSVFQSAGTIALELAKSLGGDLQTKVRNYLIPSLKIDLKGLNAEDASKKLNAVISTTLDKMADDVFGKIIGKYQQIGEGMLETATRVVAEVAVVRDALKTSGMKFGGDAIAISDMLVQAVGGLKEFQQVFADYLDKFYNDKEKLRIGYKHLIDALNEQGMILPKTRDGYRKLVEAQDLSTTKGREHYSTLISLSGAADTFYTGMKDIIDKLNDGVKQARSDLLSAYKDESSALKDTINQFDEFTKSLRAFKDSLKIGDLSTGSPHDKYITSKHQFDSVADAIEKGYGTTKASHLAYTNAISNLQGNAQEFLTISRGFNASSLDYKADYKYVMDILGKGINSSEKVKSDTEKQLDELKKSVKGLININESVMSVKKAIDRLHDAIEKRDDKTKNFPYNLQQQKDNIISFNSSEIKNEKYQKEYELYSKYVPTFDNALKYVKDLRKQKGWTIPNESWDTELANQWLKQSRWIFGRFKKGLSAKDLSEKNKIALSYFQNLIHSFGEGDKLHPDSYYIDQIKKINGVHLNGLSKVPFDGYIAELHKDEKILTSNEAKNYDNYANLMVTSSTVNNQNTRLVKEICELTSEVKDLKTKLVEQHNTNQQSLAVERAGFIKVISKLEIQIEEVKKSNRIQARTVREKL